MEKNTYNGPERRKSFRIAYKPEKSAKLRIGERYFEIADISEMGLRIYNEENAQLQDSFQGEIRLLCGETLKVEGLIVRIAPAFIYMNVNRPIPLSILQKEQSILK